MKETEGNGGEGGVYSLFIPTSETKKGYCHTHQHELMSPHDIQPHVVHHETREPHCINFQLLCAAASTHCFPTLLFFLKEGEGSAQTYQPSRSS